MSKYTPLWEHIKERNSFPLKLSFEDIAKISGFEIDHSFLSFKKETYTFGFAVKKISLKEKYVVFDKIST